MKSGPPARHALQMQSPLNHPCPLSATPPTYQARFQRATFLPCSASFYLYLLSQHAVQRWRGVNAREW